MSNNDSINLPQPKSREPFERGMVKKLASVDEDVRGARRRDMAQENGGVAPSVPVPRLYCLDANGASLGGVGEAADARDALAGASAEEDELRLPRLLVLRRRGRDSAARGAAGGGEEARRSAGAEAREGEAGGERRGSRRGAGREMRAQGADRGERARERRMQHGQAVGTQESGDRARGGGPRHRESADASVCLAAAAGESVSTGSPRTLATCRLSDREIGRAHV